jgi:UDP-N-acetylmuramoylalanine--D-glutamate ligase
MKEILGSSVLLVGYGLEGKSTHQYLIKHHPEKKIGIADQQETIKPITDSKQVDLHLGKDYLQNIFHYDVIIKSAGVPLRLPELQKYLESGKRLTSATNIFFSECPGMVIGVTGTKGKSTTSSLISDILKEKYQDVRLVGNIGQPALDYLPGSDKNTIFVVELSSYQLEDIRYSPHIAVLLTVFPEHLNYHGDLSKYIKAKGRIVRYQTTQDIVIFNPSHKIVSSLASKTAAKKYRFSLYPQEEANCYLKEKDIFIQRKKGKAEFVLHRNEIPLLSEGNLENTLAAISVGTLLDVPLEKIREAVSEFKPLEHRLEFIGEYHGIRFFNDSLATIPEATINAIKALGKNVETLIAGGYDRGIDFSKLGKFLEKSQVKNLILFPPSGKRIWEELVKASPENKPAIRKYYASSMKEAVQIAFQNTSNRKICLLSPASPSFGLFRDYQERGELFKKSVQRIGGRIIY